MPDSLPLSTLSKTGHARNPSLLPPDQFEDAESSSDLVHLSRDSSRRSSPSAHLPHPDDYRRGTRGVGAGLAGDGQLDEGGDSDFEHWGTDDEDMPSDLRRASLRPHHEAQAPLLSSDKQTGYEHPSSPALTHRRSARFRERDSEALAKAATRKRYTYAACFLAVSLVSFAVQTETAVYIQHNLGWKKAYCML